MLNLMLWLAVMAVLIGIVVELMQDRNDKNG